jgi:hypothetical protein
MYPFPRLLLPLLLSCLFFPKPLTKIVILSEGGAFAAGAEGPAVAFALAVVYSLCTTSVEFCSSSPEGRPGGSRGLQAPESRPCKNGALAPGLRFKRHKSSCSAPSLAIVSGYHFCEDATEALDKYQACKAGIGG